MRSRPCPGAPAADIAPLKPTPVYDAYWRFAAERQRIFFARAEGQPPPWTEDQILASYKFTNAYRASDRVSQFLIRRVIYRDDLPQTHDETFFRVMLFKLFNKVETWELLEEKLGPLSWKDYEFKRFDRVLTKAMAGGRRIYSAAYIMPSAGSLGHDRKHRNHLALVERMMRDGLPAKRSLERRAVEKGPGDRRRGYAHPAGPRSRRAGLQPAGHRAAIAVHRTGVGPHLPRQDHEME
jgi:alpha-glutamyl/putrescinyl thymine pyrophosphorylase clade 1